MSVQDLLPSLPQTVSAELDNWRRNLAKSRAMEIKTGTNKNVRKDFEWLRENAVEGQNAVEQSREPVTIGRDDLSAVDLNFHTVLELRDLHAGVSPDQVFFLFFMPNSPMECRYAFSADNVSLPSWYHDHSRRTNDHEIPFCL